MCHPRVQERLQQELDQVMRMMMMMNDDDDNDYDDGDDNDDDNNYDNDDQVAGRGGQVRWEMRDQLPYTMATLREVQRSVVVII